MPSKRRLTQLHSARRIAVENVKKRKLEQSQQLSIAQSRIKDSQPRTHDTSDTEDTEGEPGSWFWHMSANESESESEDGEVDEDIFDLEDDQPMTKEAVASQGEPKEIRWNKEGENKLRGAYGKGSISSLRRQKLATQKLEKEASNTYSIKALWQRNRDLGFNSQANTPSRPGESLQSQPSDDDSRANTPSRPGKSSKSQPGDDVNQLYPLSRVPSGVSPSLSEQELLRIQRIEALKDLSRLIDLVTEQENKYGSRLSPYNDVYRRHIMVQQFLQTQLKSQPSQTRRALSLTIARGFGKGHVTGRNIMRWERSWVEKRIIPERKGRDDYFSWMDDEELRESMRDFARRQGDSKYSKGIKT